MRPAKRRNLGPVRRRDFEITFWGDFVPAANFDAHRDRVRYVIWQKELCPTTGRPHWQAYVEFHDAVTMEYVKNYIFADPRTHVKIRRCQRTTARDYCMKNKSRAPGQPTEVGPFEWGTWAFQGKRTDLDAVKEKINDGMRMADIVEEHFSTVARHAGGVKYCKQMASQMAGQKERSVTVHLYYGPTGTGKTRAAMDEALRICDGDVSRIFILDSDCAGGGTVWFDGYEGGPILIIDDYNSWIAISYLLRLLDRYPVRMQTKGAMVWAQWTHVWITSNKPMSAWTDVSDKPMDEAHRRALKRRFNWIVEMPKLGERIVHKAPE